MILTFSFTTIINMALFSSFFFFQTQSLFLEENVSHQVLCLDLKRTVLHICPCFPSQSLRDNKDMAGDSCVYIAALQHYGLFKEFASLNGNF